MSIYPEKGGWIDSRRKGDNDKLIKQGTFRDILGNIKKKRTTRTDN